MNRWFLDPLYGRGYPEDMLALYGPNVPTIHPGDMEAIATPTDFLGVNTYAPGFVRADPTSPSGTGLNVGRLSESRRRHACFSSSALMPFASATATAAALASRLTLVAQLLTRHLTTPSSHRRRAGSDP